MRRFMNRYGLFPTYTRYMRLNHCFLESYYPSDCTGANTPLYVLTEGSVLQKRVEKEFSTLWETLT